MADTKRVLSDILALYADNTTQQIAPQDHRDFIVSALGSLYIRETSTGITLDGDDIVILATGGASGITITLPPLRERPDDIPLLVQHFIRHNVLKSGKKIEGVSAAAMAALTKYAWPGNVRELENCIEHAVLLGNDGVIRGHNLPPTLQMPDAAASSAAASRAQIRCCESA